MNPFQIWDEVKIYPSHQNPAGSGYILAIWSDCALVKINGVPLTQIFQLSELQRTQL